MKGILSITALAVTAISSSSLAQSPTITAVEKRKSPQPETVITNHSNQQTVTTIRDAYFIHGLGGSPQSWNETAARLENDFELVYHIPEYNNAANADMAVAAQECHRWMNNNQANVVGTPSTAIAIAHSQGGIVGKAIENESIKLTAPIYNRKFGGLVTIGTPHQGAMILNNSDPNGSIKKLEAFVDDGCNKLGRVILADVVSSNWALRNFSRAQNFRTTLFQSIPSALCGTFAGTVLPLLLDDLATDLTQDYNVGSPMVNTLNTMNTAMPVVAFYGEEDQPVFFRTISSFTMDSRNITSTDPYTGGDDDTEYVVAANTMMNEYLAKYNKYNNRNNQHLKRARNYERLAWWSPGFLILAALARDDARMAREHRGYSYDAFAWVADANNNWLEIIGAKHDVLVTNTNNQVCNTTFKVDGQTLRGRNGQPLQVNVLGNCFNSVTTFRNLRVTIHVPHPFSGLARVGQGWVQFQPYPVSNPSYWALVPGGLDPAQFNLFAAHPSPIPVTKLAAINRKPKTTVQLQTVIDPSDGVVTAASQAGYPNAVAKVKMPNTNHQQMRNSTETKRAFDDLFDRNIPNTRFFYTDRR